VSVHDGTSTAAPQLAIVYGAGQTDVQTTRANVTLRFYSNFQNAAAGVQIALTMVRQPSICDAASISLAAGQVLPVTTNTGPAYPFGSNCVSTISAPAGHAIGVTVSRVNIAPSGDLLTIFDGASTDSPLLLPAIAGSSPPGLIASSGSSVTLRFTTSTALALGGAQLVLQALLQRDMCASSAEIVLGTSNLVTSAADVAFASGAAMMVPVTTNGGAVYRSPIACALAVKAPTGFLSFAHVTQHAADAGASFSVYDGALVAPAALLSAGPSSARPWDATGSTLGGAVALSFISTAAAGAALSGARLTVAAVQPAYICPSPSAPLYFEPGQTLRVATTADSYGNSLSCAMNVGVPPGWVINVRFISVALDNGVDFVSVHDGTSTAAPQLAIVYGAGQTDVQTTRANVTLRFFSNFQTTNAGVQIALTMVRQPSICDAASAAIALAAGQVLPVTTNTGHAYPFGSNCVSTITAPAGYAIGVTVSRVGIAAGDLLTIFDGASTDSPLLLPAITGSSPPGLIASSGTSVTLRFTSATALTSGGAQLVLQALLQRDMCASGPAESSCWARRTS
jgi:hypothetical protein